MNDDDKFATFVRSRIPPVDASVSPIRRDVWPLIVERTERRPEWPWTDLALAAAITITLLMRPDLMFLAAFYF
jgi:hypothetical protein